MIVKKNKAVSSLLGACSNLSRYKQASKLAALGAFGILLVGCKTETLIPSDQLVATENSVYTKSGRFFVVGKEDLSSQASAIYEVISSEDGYTYVPVVNSPVQNGTDCFFSGITAYKNTLYAACNYSLPIELGGFPSNSVLVKVDTAKDEGEEGFVESTPLLGTYVQTNGMATDYKGNIYISNSLAFVTTYMFGVPEAAIFKVTPSSEGPFSVTAEPWYPAMPTDVFPNGIQVKYNQLYYSTGPSLQKMHIQYDGTAGIPTTVYNATTCNIIDDFDVSLTGLIAATEIRNPAPQLDPVLSPFAPCTEPMHGKVVVLSDYIPNLIYNTHQFEDGTLPSSLRFTKGLLFDDQALVMTDYFGGGVKLVTDE